MYRLCKAWWNKIAMNRIRGQGGGGTPTDAILFIPSMIELFAPSDGKEPLCRCWSTGSFPSTYQWSTWSTLDKEIIQLIWAFLYYRSAVSPRHHGNQDHLSSSLPNIYTYSCICRQLPDHGWLAIISYQQYPWTWPLATKPLKKQGAKGDSYTPCHFIENKYSNYVCSWHFHICNLCKVGDFRRSWSDGCGYPGVICSTAAMASSSPINNTSR